MKVSVNNLGPLDAGTLEMGRFTVICGANNFGKTYLAYAVYSYHQYFHTYFTARNYRHVSHPIVTTDLMRKLAKVGEAESTVDIDKLLNHFRAISTDICSNFVSDLGNWYAADPDDFKDVKLDFTIGVDNAANLIRSRLESISNFSFISTTIDFSAGKLLFVHTPGHSPNGNGSSLSWTKARLAAALDSVLLSQLVRRSFIVTSERMGISLFHKDLDAHRNALVETMQSSEKTERRELAIEAVLKTSSKFAKPISSEIDFVRDLERISKRRGELRDNSNEKHHEQIEDMLGAKFVVDKTGIWLVSKARGQRKYKIPLHRASTASRELANLFFYLKHEARKTDLLVMDEPESHLSSDNQKKIVRLLCACVNAGMHVLITTHSETIMKEINNNILLGQLGENKDELYRKRKHYAGHAGISHEDVKAYYLENHKITPCEVDESGMDIAPLDQRLLDHTKDTACLMDMYMRSNSDKGD